MHKLLNCALAILFVCGVTSCGGGGSGANAPVSITPTPSVTLETSAETQLLGKSIILTWQSVSASRCTASGAWEGDQTLNGTLEVPVDTLGNNTFTLTCEGAGGTGSDFVVVDGFRQISGVTVDGYIRDAEVFIDVNGNLKADDNEETVLSDNDGKFVLKYVDGQLVSVGGFDLASGNLLDSLVLVNKLASYSDFAVVTPVTTLASFLDDPDDINDILGIDPSIDVSVIDPVAAFNDGEIYADLYQKGSQLTILALAAQSLAKTSDTFQETSTDYFELIASVAVSVDNLSNEALDLASAGFIAQIVAEVVEQKNLEVSEVALEAITNGLATLLPLVGAEEASDAATAVFTFATDTLLSDIEQIVSRDDPDFLIGQYQNDVLDYLVSDQNISSSVIDDLVVLVTNGSSGGTDDSGSSGGTDDSGSSGGTDDSGSSGGTDDSGSSGGTDDSGSSGGTDDSGSSGGTDDSGSSGGTDDSGSSGGTGDSGSSGGTDDSGSSGDTDDSGSSGGTDDSGSSGSTDDSGSGSVIDPSVLAEADEAATSEDIAVVLFPLANDTIISAGYETSISVGAVSDGTVEVNSDNSLTFTPSQNFFGSVSFIYTAIVNSVSASATVTIEVSSINDLPIINGVNATEMPDENQTAVVTVNASDVETSSLSYSITGTDSSLFSISNSGALTFITAPDYESPSDADSDNSYAITITVGDGEATVSQSVTVEVQNVPDVVSGVAVDGYVAGATVFQDLDNDGELDSGEPNSATNALGAFSLNLSSVNKSAPVRIINGYDLATNEIHPSIMDISSTETGSYIITPISTLVGRLKIADTTLPGTVPESMVAAALGITLADSPNDSILGFDPIAFFNGADATLAAEARPVFAASQLLMAQGGGNYGVNKYITDQVLSSLSSTLSTQSGTSISMSSSADITAIKQDAYDAIFNGIVDTTLSNNPPINNIQFKNNKAVITDYLNGSTSSQVQHSIYGVHDGSTTLVADLIGAKLDHENLKQIIENDGTGTPLDLSFELSSLPVGSGTTPVNLRLFYGNDAVQNSDEDYLQVALTANWESDGTTLQVKLPASSDLIATFFDRGGTTLSRTVTNLSEDLITAAAEGPNRPQSLKIRLSALFSAFPTEVSGLSSFLDGAANFTYQVEFGSLTLYDHLDKPFTKIQGTFGVASTPSVTIFADDIYVHENAVSRDIMFRLSQASSTDVTVDYAISSASSASSSDYTLSEGSVTFPAGSTSATLSIAVTNDTEIEAQEELRLSLSNAQNAVLGRVSVSAYITDGEKILDNTAQNAILVNNIFKDSKISINEYIKNKLDASSVTMAGTSYTYSQVLLNKGITSDVYAYVDSIVDDYEVMAEAIINAIMTKSDSYVESQLSGFSTYSGFAQALTQLNSGLKGLDVSQIAGINIESDGTYPSDQSASTLQAAVEGKIDTLVTLAADTVADILGTDTNTNFPNANVIIGTDGNDTIAGTSGSDLIASFNGDDTVNAAAGNDKILGGSGVDTINGGDNDDHIYGYAGADILSGDAGADKILGGLDNDTIRGGAGDDDLRGEAGDDTIYTGAGADTVTGGLGDDTIIVDGL
jgi:Ca2+-binding RTX toxin-like protein